MDLSLLQIFILSLYLGLSMIDGLSMGLLGMNGTIQSAIFAGIVTGNPELGLYVGGTLQLMSLGLGTFGGASIPNYPMAAMIVTAMATNLDQAMLLVPSLGIPLATVSLQFDIYGRMGNTFFQQLADKYVDQGNMRMIEIVNFMGWISWALSRFIPMFLALLIGPSLVTIINNFTPEWLITGFTVAGKMLPAVGFTVLLQYLPAKKYFHFVVLGFILATYFSLPILPISLIGGIIALVMFQMSSKNNSTNNIVESLEGDGGYED